MAGGSIPSSLAPIFQAAGAANRIPPAVLAGIASVESNLGQNMGPSSAGTVGLMQFLPSTARGLGINPLDARQAIFGAAKLLNQYGYQQNPTRAIGAYNGGPGNPQYGYARQVLSEAQRLGGQLGGGAAPGAAAGILSTVPGSGLNLQIPTTSFNQAGYDKAMRGYIAGSAIRASDSNANPFNAVPGASRGFAAGLGSSSAGLSPLFQKGLLRSSPPNAAAFEQTRMQQVAVSALQQLSGMPLVNVHAGARGDVNPIPGAVIGRTDMGVDANLKPGAPILAPNDGRVVAVVPGWYQGQPYVAVQLTAGPNAGKVMYVAEQINGVPPVGTTLRKGQPIARYAAQGTGIEIGWADPQNPTQTLAQGQGNTGGPGHSNSPAGQNYRSYLGALGA